MSNQASAKLFVAAAIARNRELGSDDYELIIRQKPLAAKVFIGKEKDRKPVDPPPIVQVRVSELTDPYQTYLQSPYLFIYCSLVDDDDSRSEAERDDIKNALAGTIVSSLHRLKDTNNNDGGFFVFGDMSVRVEGSFKLQFTLYEMREKEAVYIKSTRSDPFTVYASKNWPGMAESTYLTRSFSDQGVRLRLRKEPRSRLGARGPASDNYEPRRYRVQNRRPNPPDLTQSQPSQQTQEVYTESSGSQRQAPGDYTRLQQRQVPSQSPISPTLQRKRDFSMSSQSGSYVSHADEPASKRTRVEPEFTQQQTYAQQQYALSPDYGGKLYTYPSPAANLTYPQSPHQPYGNNYSSSPLSMTPRDQANYFVPRRADTQFPALSSTYDSASGRLLTTQSQRSPTSAHSFISGLQPFPQAPFNFQPQQQPQQQQQFPQLSQTTTQNRAVIGMPTYPIPLDPDQIPMPLRPPSFSSGEMLPPVTGRAPATGMGMAYSTMVQFPTTTDDPKYARNYLFDFKQRDDTPNR